MSIHDTIRFLQVIDELAALASEGDLATPKADGLFDEFIRLSPQELVVGMAKKYLDIGLDHIKLREKVEPGWPEQK